MDWLNLAESSYKYLMDDVTCKPNFSPTQRQISIHVMHYKVYQ